MNETTVTSKGNNILNAYIELIDNINSYPKKQQNKDTKTFIEDDLLENIKKIISDNPEDDVLSVILTIDSQLNLTEKPDVRKADLYIFQNRSSKYLPVLTPDNLPQSLTAKMYEGISVGENNENVPISNLEILKEEQDVIKESESTNSKKFKYREDIYFADGKISDHMISDSDHMISEFSEFKKHQDTAPINVLAIRITTANVPGKNTPANLSAEHTIKPLGVLTIITKSNRRLDLVRLRFLLQLRHALAGFIQKIPKESFLHIRKSIDEEQFIRATKHREGSLLENIVYNSYKCKESINKNTEPVCFENNTANEIIGKILIAQKSINRDDLLKMEQISFPSNFISFIKYMLTTDKLFRINPVSTKNIKITNNCNLNNQIIEIPFIYIYSILVQILINIRSYTKNEIIIKIECELNDNRLKKLIVIFENNINIKVVKTRIQSRTGGKGLSLIEGQINRINTLLKTPFKILYDHKTIDSLLGQSDTKLKYVSTLTLIKC